MPTIRCINAIFLLAVVGLSAHAACPAEVVMSLEQEMKTVSAVVVGKAIKQEYTATGPGGTWVDGTYYTVLVSKTQYGSAAKEIKVFSENSSGHFPMFLNEPYLLFISTCDGVQYIDRKGNSGPLKTQMDTFRRVQNWRQLGR